MAEPVLFRGVEAEGPRLFGLPPGADFPRLLVQGLTERLNGHPPEAMAHITLFLNTDRMRRRIVTLMTAQGARFLPRLRLVTDLSVEAALAGVPPAAPPLRRRLEIAQLVRRLLDVDETLAPKHAAFDLADSLARLIEELQGEGVSPETLINLDVSQHSEHWKRTQRILSIVLPLFAQDAEPDAQTRLRRTVAAMAADWQATPPQGPVIVAGSTGSRGTTLALMRAVAALPQGALVLPGFDTDMPDHLWPHLDDALTAEDHPQYRFHKLRRELGGAVPVRTWVDVLPPDPARNAMISLALRPAPVTDQWLTDGPGLGDLRAATANLTLIEADTPRQEAMALALILRQAAEDDGLRVALITPDRNLTRMVTAALDRWGIRPDDSAGKPLALSPPGRLLRHVAEMAGSRLSVQDLLILLKHPLTASAGDWRGPHLRQTRNLELHLRRHGPAFPGAEDLLRWGQTQPDVAEAGAWTGWLAEILRAFAIVRDQAAALPLGERLASHLALTERIAQGPDTAQASQLWEKEAGQKARSLMNELAAEADHGGSLTLIEYSALFSSLIAGGEVREDVEAHPRIMIWGTIEARVQGADLVVLAGLNEGVWPRMPAADPWLNRQMRLAAGLLLPERQIGLSAHDFQQAIAAPRVILSRARRDAEAQTVPSRWLNRMMNLIGGLPGTHGPEAAEAMRTRGNQWLQLASALERPAAPLPPAPRPAPRPPVAVRPDHLSVTDITKLIRDPYAIYARHVLRLRQLDPLAKDPDARLRGTILHQILETYVRERLKDPAIASSPERAHGRLMQIAEDMLQAMVPWPEARALWAARLDRAADHFLHEDTRHGGTPVVMEDKGRCTLDPLPFTLTARPDRIDLLPDGRVHLMDYKTGPAPGAKEQKHFDKQLQLEAAMALRGAFAELGPVEPAGASYICVGTDPKTEEAIVTQSALDEVWDQLIQLITRYMHPAQGFAARRAPKKKDDYGEYDHLARYGEWGMSDPPTPEDIA